MRDIIFRGKRVGSGEWVEGFFCNGGYFLKNKAYIMETAYSARVSDLNKKELEIGGFAEVDPETVGQYTGLTDKNGKRIFEGDILFDPHPSIQKMYSVIWFDDSFVRRTADGHYLSLNILYADEYEIVGNIHDNSELLA